MNTLNVNIGDVVVGQAEDELQAVLGSCVALVAWHPQTKLGVMGHVLIPTRPEHSAASAGLDGRYADECWQIMVQKLAVFNLHPRDCRLRLIGGASVFNMQGMEIGIKNLAKLTGILEKQGLQADVSHSGHAGSRLLRFQVGEGLISVRHTKQQITVG
jgi:chemotaxis protein CheD